MKKKKIWKTWRNRYNNDNWKLASTFYRES